MYVCVFLLISLKFIHSRTPTLISVFLQLFICIFLNFFFSVALVSAQGNTFSWRGVFTETQRFLYPALHHGQEIWNEVSQADRDLFFSLINNITCIEKPQILSVLDCWGTDVDQSATDSPTMHFWFVLIKNTSDWQLFTVKLYVTQQMLLILKCMNNLLTWIFLPFSFAKQNTALFKSRLMDLTATEIHF